LKIDVRDGSIGVNADFPTLILRPTSDNQSSSVRFSNPGTNGADFGGIAGSIEYGHLSGDLRVTANWPNSQFVLKNSGRIGMGTPFPGAHLDVEGSEEVPVIRGIVDYTGPIDVEAFRGESQPLAGYGKGAYFLGGYMGMHALVPSDSATSKFTYGIFSQNLAGGSGGNTGVYGGVSAAGTGNAYGIYGYAPINGSNRWAGYFAGDYYFSGSSLSPSDARLKKNIADLEGGLEKVLALSPKTFEFRAEELSYANLAEGPQMGFLSQEVERVLPTLVEEALHEYPDIDPKTGEPIRGTSRKLEIKSLKYRQLIPLLTAAIQEQQALITEKSERIDILENEVRELREAVQGLLDAQKQETQTLTSARLDQNQPNPFREETQLTFFIPQRVNRAELIITDAKGAKIWSQPIDSRGEGSFLFQTNTLAAGLYHCSLMLDGQIMQTRKMLATENR